MGLELTPQGSGVLEQWAVLAGDHAGIGGHAVLGQVIRERPADDELGVDRCRTVVLGTQVLSPVLKQGLELTDSYHGRRGVPPHGGKTRRCTSAVPDSLLCPESYLRWYKACCGAGGAR